MGNDMNSLTKPRRVWLVLALAPALLAGLVLGVVADRLYLWASQRPPDPRLIGDWVAQGTADNEENIIRFHQDGTYDSTLLRKADGKFTEVWQVSHQYRWVNRDTIEMYDPFHGWTTRKLVLEGDELKVLYKGEVWRLKRKTG